MARAQSEQGMLAKAGFLHPQHALELLADPILENVDKNWLIEQLRHCADPNQALLEYVRLASAVESAGAEVSQIFAKVLADAVASRKLFAILGLSSALSNRLIAQPCEVEIFLCAPEKTRLLELLTPYLAADIKFDYAAAVEVLRNYYWQRIMQIAAADLTQVEATAGMPEVGKAISALVEAALDGALAIAQRAVPESSEVGLAIIAMGKLGGEELNYISDVDVIYVARSLNPELSEAAMLEKATALAQIVARVVGAPGAVPALWKIDANLRPEGKEGPLVRTLESCLRYYNEWAESWEFQAHIKARPVAGDKELGTQYVQALAALVWRAAERSSFVADTQAMRRRVESLVPAKDAPRQIKLGAGGLRDVEFTVQLLQLVHGRADTTLRAAGTLEAITALSNGGYISRRAAERLREDYKFLRTMEHRLQLQRFRRCQVLPEDSEELRRLARSISGSGFRTEEDLVSCWQRVRAEVRKLHLEIYYRPLLPETAKLSVDDVSLQPEAAQARLAAIGYRDPISALQHIEALTAGISRTAAIQKQLLPVMIGWFAQGPDPDQGLQAFRIVSEELGATSWYMRTLRDSGAAAERLARVLSSSRYIARELPALAEAISWLDEDSQLTPRSAAELRRELDSMGERASAPQDLARAGRYLRRRELLRTALAQVLDMLSLEQVQGAISTAGDIVLEAAFRAAKIKTLTEQEQEEAPVDLAVIAMGRFGGKELSYASDADLIFVHRPRKNAAINVDFADSFAISWAKNIVTLLQCSDAEPPLVVDTDLRPEGKNGPLSRSLESCRHYYQHWIETWEKQALLRARFCCGDCDLGEKFLLLIADLRYPPQGITAGEIRDIRRIKARVEKERMPRGIAPSRHVKLGRGGLADVEWCIQLLQLEQAGKYPLLRTPQTLAALAAAAKCGLLSAQEAKELREAWVYASQIRNFNALGTGRLQSIKVDVLPAASEQVAVLGALFGYPPGRRHNVEEDYLRRARRARAVVENIFYGDTP